VFHFVQLTICEARLRSLRTSKQCSSMAMTAYFRSRFAQSVTLYYGSSNPARAAVVAAVVSSGNSGNSGSSDIIRP
jgi:hypothetical protein